MVATITLLALIVVGGIVLRILTQHVEQEPDVEECIISGEPDKNSRNIASHSNAVDILQRYGHKAVARLQMRPMHNSISDVLHTYECLTFDDLTRYIDRGELSNVAPEGFVRIGTWGDGSAVLARSDSDDPRIYIEDFERFTPEQIRVLANTIDEYIVLAQLHDDEAQDAVDRTRR